MHAHSTGARAAETTEAEIREAVAAAVDVRMWSIVLNGMDYDSAFVAEFGSMHDNPAN